MDKLTGIHAVKEALEANRAFWMKLGATSGGTLGTSEVLKIPGTLIVLTPSEKRHPGDGSAIGHMAFRVKSLGHAAPRTV